MSNSKKKPTNDYNYEMSVRPIFTKKNMKHALQNNKANYSKY